MSEKKPSVCKFTGSVPAKIFLLGEYAVVADRGLPAITLSLEQRFRLNIRPEPQTGVSPFHPESPAGKLIAEIPEAKSCTMEWQDPFQGTGGFGASTAQFALAYAAFVSSGPDCHEIWSHYRKLHKKDSVPPSGADLAVQVLGGTQIFYPAKDSNRLPDCEAVADKMSRFPLLVFSASHQPGRKTATHHHLRELRRAGFPDHPAGLVPGLRTNLETAMAALDSGDIAQLAEAMNGYADTLALTGLEAAATSDDRKHIRSIPGVLAVKGTGAMQADAIVVLLNSHHRDDRARVTEEVVNLRGLRFITDNPGQEEGLQWQTNS